MPQSAPIVARADQGGFSGSFQRLCRLKLICRKARMYWLGFPSYAIGSHTQRVPYKCQVNLTQHEVTINGDLQQTKPLRWPSWVIFQDWMGLHGLSMIREVFNAPRDQGVNALISHISPHRDDGAFTATSILISNPVLSELGARLTNICELF